VRRLGLFDATMIVMGGIIGAGIFINPALVARQVHTPVLILGAWFLGGLVAMAGAFIYAELSARRPEVGGQYAYLREAFHPAIAFLYGWSLLLVIQTGGMAAVAVTFARYFVDLTGVPISDAIIAASALGLLTLVNCFGVRVGSAVQSSLMVMKILAIAGLVVCGLLLTGKSQIESGALFDRPFSFDFLSAIGAAMVPVLFAYGGWQTSSFIAGEVREPQRNLPRGLMIGVAGVILLYLAVSFVCLRALGPEGLANTRTPATDVMRHALGESGVKLIALGIALSTFGFLSQGMLTAPRVYFAMAEDGLFFKSVGWLHPSTRVPVVAIALQGILAVIIALSGKYEDILNYVVSVDFIAFGLTGTCVFVFRRRAAQVRGTLELRTVSGQTQSSPSREGSASYRVPGHPVITLLFIAVCWLVVINTVYQYPKNSAIGLAIVFAGVPAYFFWRWWRPRI
jgi:basic amino acid/polyamine antiporter, APA family